MSTIAKREGISAAAIMARLDAISASVIQLAPRNMIIYKPQKDVKRGVALKVGYRYYQPTLEDGTVARYWTGGCFMEIVSQKPSEDENARFDWKNDLGHNVTVKLGLPDLGAFTLAYREFRVHSRPVPLGIRPTVKVDGKWGPAEAINQLGLVHKFDNDTTFIKWTFSDDNRSMLEIAKSKELRKGVSLTLVEESQVIRYLELAQDALLLTNA